MNSSDSNISIHQFKDICRLCLKKFPSAHTRFLIYGTSIENHSLEAILDKFFHIEVKQDDNLPQYMCTRCIFNLGQIHEFYELCQKSRRTLNAILEKAKKVSNILPKPEPEGGNTVVKVPPLIILPKVNKKKESGELIECTQCDAKFPDHQYQKHVEVHEIIEMKRNAQNTQIQEEKSTELSVLTASPDPPLKRNSDGEVLECRTCNIVFANTYQYRLHRIMKHDVIGNGRNATNYERSPQRDPRGQPVECTICNVKFLTNYQYRKHRRTHENPYGCPLCDLSFKGIAGLNSHLRTHTAGRLKRDNIGRLIECEICRTVCSSYHTLRLHKHEHIGGPKPHVCPHCGRDFIMYSRLKNHIETHSTETPFLCSMCPRRFKNQLYLHLHVKNVHTEEPPSNGLVKCTRCDRVFESLKKMRNHRTVHNVKPYLCSICGMSLSKKSHWVLHLRRHNGEKPFKCEYCDKAFVSKFQLTYHTNLHTGEKPYHCSICGKAFATPRRVQVHKKSHHSRDVFKCSYCKKEFLKKSSFKTHECTGLIVQEEQIQEGNTNSEESN